MRRLLPYLVMSLVFGAVAVLLPGVLAGPSATSVWRAPIEQPSVWAFQGLFVVGFVLSLTARLDLLDLPLLALAMVGVFPLAAAILLARGSGLVEWPREFYLYAAWLIPSLVGLFVGRTIRTLQRRARKTRKR